MQLFTQLAYHVHWTAHVSDVGKVHPGGNMPVKGLFDVAGVLQGTDAHAIVGLRVPEGGVALAGEELTRRSGADHVLSACSGTTAAKPMPK